MTLARFGKVKYLGDQISTTLITDGDYHFVWVNIKTHKRDDRTINLFLLRMGNVQLIPKQEQFGLFGREIVMIGHIIEHITNEIERGVVVYIGFKMRDGFDIFSDPHNKI